MKIYKVNDNQIMCKVSIDELNKIGITQKDLNDGTENSSAFFSALIDSSLEVVKASDSIGVETMIFKYNESTKIFDIAMNIVEYDDFDEEYEEDDDDEIIDEGEYEEDQNFVDKYENYKTNIKKVLEETKEENPILMVQKNTLDEIIDITKLISVEHVESFVYKYNQKYYLFIPKKQFNKMENLSIILQLADYTDFDYISEIALTRIKEFGEVIVKEQAIDKLKNV